MYLLNLINSTSKRTRPKCYNINMGVFDIVVWLWLK
jgi:hypothetical protein